MTKTPSERTREDAASLVDAALRVLEARSVPSSELRQVPEVQAIVEAPDEVRCACFVEAASRRDSWDLVRLAAVIGSKRVALSAEEVAVLLASPPPSGPPVHFLHRETLRALGRHIEHAHSSFSDGEKERVRPLLIRAAREVDYEPTAARFRKLVGPAGFFELIAEGDDIGHRLRAAFDQSLEADDVLDAALHLLSSSPASGRPGKEWYADAERVSVLLEQPTAFLGSLLDAALDASDTTEERHGGAYTVTRYATAPTESFLCGTAALTGVFGGAALLDQLRRLALKTITVIGSEDMGFFPRSLRLANACAQAMADIGAPSSITELLALERAVRHGTLLKQIRKAIDTLAAAQGMSTDELLERAVEAHGLEADGTRRIPLSRGTALVEVNGRSASLVFLDEDGTRRKSVPADVKETDAETLEALREDMKAIRKTIAGERHRLDGLMALDRRWPLDDWRSLYLDHPVTGRLARTLIWGFHGARGKDVVGIPRDGETVVTSSGRAVAIPAAAEVRLWHPINATADEVHDWRLYLLEQLIVQPFKQAFREVYVLTPAEEQTAAYSNRFAAHVFRQVQARALMKGRGWRPVALAWWDDGIDHGVARRVHEQFGIRAEFFFDPIDDIEPETGDLYPYCTSDQVRFFDAENDDPMQLVDVPRLVFTETMRDVDLFVGVTSVGADPEWLDRREGRRFETYWNTYSFGELTAAADIRREILEQLLPRLAIAERCELEERYLKVRGDLRTYRIHLGSGNILMSPNDEYLCIVAARDSRAEKLFLPFDDDPVLSLILSKAFLLAHDTAITDETITAQIKRG